MTTDKKGAIEYLKSLFKTRILTENLLSIHLGGQRALVRPFGGTIPISGPRSVTVDDGLILVGDAAGFTSPLFEGGSHLALWSGRQAAQTIAKILKSNQPLSKKHLKERNGGKRPFLLFKDSQR